MPFADVLPLTQRPALQPLPPRQTLQQALALRPGKTTLPEVSYRAIHGSTGLVH